MWHKHECYKRQVYNCLKELQKLPQGLRLLFKKTYPKGNSIEFLLGLSPILHGDGAHVSD